MSKILRNYMDKPYIEAAAGGKFWIVKLLKILQNRQYFLCKSESYITQAKGIMSTYV